MSRRRTAPAYPLLCAWASRHAPQPAQRAALEAAGYDICHVANARDISIRMMWLDMLTALRHRLPDVIMLVTRHKQVTPFVLHLAAHQPQIVIVRAVMQPCQPIDSDEYAWAGLWMQYRVERLPSGTVGTRQYPWVPGSSEAQP